MNSSLIFRCLFALIMTGSSAASGGDWITWRSTYTHDRLTGQRVDQHTPAVDPIAPDQGNLVRSGYRHYRSTIQAGQSADNLHIVNEWGRPVVPYEHWRFPYRPYGAPYPAWGPPTPNVLGNFSSNYGPLYGAPPQGSASPYGNGAQAGWSGGMQGAPGSYSSGSQGGYPGYYPGGQAGSNYGYPGFPLVPPYQPAPWYDGMYPSAPPLDNQSDRSFFYRPPSSLAP